MTGKNQVDKATTLVVMNRHQRTALLVPNASRRPRLPRHPSFYTVHRFMGSRGEKPAPGFSNRRSESSSFRKLFRWMEKRTAKKDCQQPADFPPTGNPRRSAMCLPAEDNQVHFRHLEERGCFLQTDKQGKNKLICISFLNTWISLTQSVSWL